MSPIRPENRDRYPANWPEVRREVLVRACWACECVGECGRHPTRCGAADGAPIPGTSGPVIPVVLTVAHLDHTPEHCDLGNLRAMCQACHFTYDAGHHAQTRVRVAREELEAAGQLRMGETP